MKEYFTKNRTNILIILAFIIMPFIFFEGTLHLNSLLFGMRDAQYGFFPAHDLKIQIVKNLELPLWDRYIFSGYPMLATPSDSALYPVDLILGLIFPVTLSYNLSILFHYSLAGIFLFFFMKEYSLDKLACFISGLVFMFSGMMITHRDHASRIFTMVWIPLILFFLEKFRKSRRIEFVLVASVFYAISFFAGDPQLFLYSSIIILFFILYYSLIYEGARNYRFLLALLVFIFGTLIAAVQLVPVAIMTQNSYRNVISYAYFSDFSFDSKLLPVLVFPFFFGRGSYIIPGIPEYFSKYNAGEMIRYFGILTIPLAILSIFKRNKHKFLWLFIMAFALLLVFGKNTEFYRFMYHVPLYNKFRIPTRNWFEFGFAFSVLAGFGFDSLINRDERTKKIIAGAVSYITLLLLSFITFFVLLRNAAANGLKSFLDYKGAEFRGLLSNLVFNNYSVYIPITLLIITIAIFTVLIFRKNKAVLAVLIIFIFLDLFSWGHFMDRPRNASYVQKKLTATENLKFLAEEQPLFRIYPKAKELEDYKLYPNMNIHYGVESISGHDPLFLKSVGTITGFPQDPESGVDWEKLLGNNVILSMLNTRYIMLDKPADTEKLLKNIEKARYSDLGIILDLNNYLKESQVYIDNITREKELTLTDSAGNLEKFEFPAEIKKNKKYLVSFYIRSDNNLDNNINFDFFGQSYDNPLQEFSVDPKSITENYQPAYGVIDSGLIPDKASPVFRIFTNSGGRIWIKDLEIHEVSVDGKKNYEAFFSNDSSLVIENLNYLPRFYFVEKVLHVDDITEAKEVLWKKYLPLDDSKFDPAKTALVEKFNNAKQDFKISDSKIEIISYKNNSVELKSYTGGIEFLVFSDTYDPGWQAFIDGNKTEIYRTNGMLKGILVPGGDHEIIFRYRPPYFLLTGIVSMVTLLLMAGISAFLFLRKKHKDLVQPVN